MTDWTRRHFVGVTAASAAAALVRTAAAAPEKAAGGPVTLKVDLTGDGIPLSAGEYGALLARLAAAPPSSPTTTPSAARSPPREPLRLAPR